MPKFKSKLFCVATEGNSTDGRTITREWIQQMAETYDRKVFGARIWLEHMRGVNPDGLFKAYGDVISLQAKEKENGKLGLFAEISPTDHLIEINKQRQKIYTSIEIELNFADTGKAYLVGLGITDSPASLGTDILEFSQKNPEVSPLVIRKHDKNNLFSAAQETEIELVEVKEQPSLSDRVKNVLGHFRSRADEVDNNLNDVLDVVEELAKYTAETENRVQELLKEIESFADHKKDFDSLKTAFEDFKQSIHVTDANPTNRPAADGSDGQVLADC